MEEVNRVATIATAEAWRIHRDWLAESGDDYDPRVKWRMLNQWDNLDGSIERGYAG